MVCPDCKGNLINLPGHLFDGEQVKQCIDCGALWDEDQLTRLEEVLPEEDRLEPVAPAESFETYFRRNQSQPEEPEPEEDSFTETELTNDELADENDYAGVEDNFIERRVDLSRKARPEPRYVPLEDQDELPYDDWMGA